MQIENDYDKEVYNGDIGYIVDVDPEAGELVASFDGRSVTFGFGELDTLVPAYAATIRRAALPIDEFIEGKLIIGRLIEARRDQTSFNRPEVRRRLGATPPPLARSRRSPYGPEIQVEQGVLFIALLTRCGGCPACMALNP